MLPRYQSTLQTSEEAAKEGLASPHSIESQNRGLGETKTDIPAVRSRAQQAVTGEGTHLPLLASRGPQMQIPY